MLKPLLDRVIIRKKSAAQKTSGGLYIPDTAEGEHIVQGEVVAVGPGGYTQKGVSIPMGVKVGDIVLFDGEHGAEITHNGEKLTLIREVGLFAVIG